MKRLDLLDDESAELLGFGWIVEAVAPLSSYGARRFDRIEPFRPGNEAAARARAELVVQTAAQLGTERVAALGSILATVPDVASALARASLGESLDDADFLELMRFCEACERAELANETTQSVTRLLAPGRARESEFYLADGFDGNLSSVRDAFSQAQAELDAARGRESERVARALGREEVAGDEFIVMRADLRGGLPPGARVVREAPTYLLCALDYGEQVLAVLARRDAAAQTVAACETRVRAKLSAQIAARANDLVIACDALAELDVTLGAVRFAQRYACTAAEVRHEARLAFTHGRFLPLEEELATAGRSFVPIDLELEGVSVLTGPNMGGKSVSLQTCGFLALLCAYGLPVPAASAQIGLFDQIAWLGLGREERAGGLLSSFAQELTALRSILDRQAARLLVLVDEFARTTNPHEGKALVVALLERLCERGACGLAATHLEGVAQAAGVVHFAVRGLEKMPELPQTHDLSEALARLAAAMDYRIVEVRGEGRTRADAIALAELLGLDRGFVEAATRALSQH